jgi:hypothetical protein
VASESEFVLDPDDVLDIFVVRITESLEYFDLYLSLLVELFPVLKDFDSYRLFRLVVKALNHNAKGTSSEFLLDFISVVDLILSLVEKITRIVIKTKVVRLDLLLSRQFILASELSSVVSSDALILGVDVNVMNNMLVHDFLSFVLTQMLSIVT